MLSKKHLFEDISWNKYELYRYSLESPAIYIYKLKKKMLLGSESLKAINVDG